MEKNTYTQKAFIIAFAFLTLLSVFVPVAVLAVPYAKTGANSAEYVAFLVRESTALTAEMGMLAASDAYASAMTQSPEVTYYFSELGAAAYNKPLGVYFLTLSPEKTEKFAQIAMPVELHKIEPAVKQLFLKKINAVLFAKMMNGQYGSAFLAAATILETGKSFLEPAGWNGAVSVLLTYEGEYASLTAFSKSGDGVISAQSTFTVFSDQMRENLAQNKDPYFGATDEEFFTVYKK